MMREDIFTAWMGKSEGRRIFDKPKCRWEDNINTDLNIIGRKVADGIYLPQDSDVF
jgi:hypothetical protein